MTDLVPDRDYRSYCEKRSVTETLPAGSAVALDYLRFWKETVELGHVNPNDVGRIYVDALSSWSSTGADSALRTEAATYGFSNAEWDTLASDHGIDQ